MSEEVKSGAVNEEEEYRISVAENEKFDYLTQTKYIDSNELCKKISDIFKFAFADCYGCTFDPVPGANTFMISLYFDHDNHGDDEVLAVSRDVDQDNTKNATLRRTRSYGRRLFEGDHYRITKSGISALTPFMMDQYDARAIYKNSNKNYGRSEINWDKVVSETADSSYGYGNVPRQLTKISFLDINKIVELIYGDTNEEGQKLKYGVQIIRSTPSIMGGVSVGSYMLAINCISEDNLFALARRFGFGVQAGLNIIR